MGGSESTAFFVYGTLRRGQHFFERLAGDALTITPAIATGTLYDLPRRGYPIAVDTGRDTLVGEVMTFPDPAKTLRRLDRLEGFEEHDAAAGDYVRYQRTARLLGTTETVTCWIYLATPKRFATLAPEAVRIPDGDWVAFSRGDVVS